MKLKPSIFLDFCMIFLVWMTPAAAQAGERLRMEPGTFFVGGSVGFEYSKSVSGEMDTGPGVKTWEANPSAGVFIRRGLALTLSWLWQNREVGDDGDTTNAGAFGVRLVGRTESVHPYMGLELLFQRLTGVVDLTQAGLRISVGMLIPLNSRVALDTGLKVSLLQGSVEVDGDPFDYGTATFSFGYFGIVGTF
ncbi:MAG: hypothetical protein CVT83_03230 [Alphaproteobacteria bacterium HGW-Alphaproteobacteria-5]|nr:MAG: hypothetical protein CVT83_03230 [Alphaproteobacteria bacterium HGW-Alphaproteobacteria-5]